MKKERIRVSSIFILILFMTSLTGQNNTDSLKILLSKKNSANRFETLNNLIDSYQYNNPDSAYYYAQILQAEAHKHGDLNYESLGYRGMGISHFFKMKYFKAEQDIQGAIKLQEQLKDTSGLANSYKILTGIYWETERYSKSIEISFKALRLYEQTNDISGIVSSYNNIGLLYKKTENPKKSLEYYKKALRYTVKYNSSYNKGNLYNNIGITYKNLSKYDSSIYFYNKALAEYEREKIESGLASTYLNMGNIYAYYFINKDSALYYYTKALNLAKRVDYTIQAKIYSGLGKIYANEKRFNKSIDTYNKIIEIAESNKDLDIKKDAHYDLYKVLKAKGAINDALEHITEYTILRDTLNMMEAKVTIANLESKFENEKKQLQIEKLKEKQKADRLMKTLLIIGILLLILTLTLTFLVFVQKRKKAKLRRELLSTEKETLEKDLQYKGRQLTSQALMMMQKNRMLDEIFSSLKMIKCTNENSKKVIATVTKQLKHSIQSEKDWELFIHYFEDINPGFYLKIQEINSKITPSESKLSALIKLNFSIKETAALLNISPDSVKTTRHVLRVKLGLKKGENIHDFLNRL